MSASTPLASHTDLWDRLLAFDLDGAAQFSFSHRLARDNGWSIAFAQRVALEYKRFLYLAATCGHPVTPSDEVDQAWHLHLVYTRSYWDDLCGQVLGFALHHGPTKGGVAEGHKFRDWYAQTLQAYQVAFGTAPPADIWPPAAQRFGEAPYFQRLNRRQYLLVPRPRWRWVLNRRVGLGLSGTLLLVGCSTRLPLNPFDWYGTDFLVLFWSLCLVLVPLALWLRQRNRGVAEVPLGLSLSTYELARLAGGGQRLADSALAAMSFAGHVELLPDKEVRRLGLAAPTSPYEATVWGLLRGTTKTDLPTIRQQAMQENLSTVQALDDTLISQGLLLPPAMRRRLDSIPLLTILGLWIFGLVKVVVGLMRDRPVGYLLLSLALLAIGGWFCWQRGAAWATGRGTALLQATADDLQRPGRSLSAHIVALHVALFGITQLKALGLGEIALLLAPPVDFNSGSDGGSGCSSSSSGCGSSGCGGCGGCGS